MYIYRYIICIYIYIHIYIYIYIYTYLLRRGNTIRNSPASRRGQDKRFFFIYRSAIDAHNNVIIMP